MEMVEESYIVEEIQTIGNTVNTLVPPAINDIHQAESAYYLALAAAAISTVNIHTVILLTNTGRTLYSKSYNHADPNSPGYEVIG